MAGRKTFTAGEVLQAADVNDFLMDQSVMVFAGTAARGSAIPSPTEGMVTYLQDADELQVYTTDWGGVGGGKILQVISTAKTDTFTTSSTTYTTITGLTATITPSSTNSKILVLAQISHGFPNGNGYGFFKVTRGGTDIYVADAAGSRSTSVFGGYSSVDLTIAMESGSIMTLDSPNSTSALTYQVEVKLGGPGSLAYINRSASDSDNAQRGRGASSITVLEVAA